MPELPEVETIKNGIESYIVGQTISYIYVSDKKMRYVCQHDLKHILPSQKVIDISRKGKHLIIRLSTSSHIIFHLGMTGTILIKDKAHMPDKHDHLILYMKNCSVVFNDARRFGYFLYTSHPISSHFCFNNYGVEPLELVFSTNYLYEKCQKSARKIKQVIMDNSIVLGVGNIYACESLYMAKIHPFSIAKQVSFDVIQKLHTSIINVLNDAIQCGGTTIKDFKNSSGKPGYFNQKLHVYGRYNDLCTYCMGKIKKESLQQRITYFCDQCQVKY